MLIALDTCFCSNTESGEKPFLFPDSETEMNTFMRVLATCNKIVPWWKDPIYVASSSVLRNAISISLGRS